MTGTVTGLILVLTLASWAACFWLGFQTGRGQSEQTRKLELADLERRFRILDGNAVEITEP